MLENPQRHNEKRLSLAAKKGVYAAFAALLNVGDTPVSLTRFGFPANLCIAGEQESAK